MRFDKTIPVYTACPTATDSGHAEPHVLESCSSLLHSSKLKTDSIRLSGRACRDMTSMEQSNMVRKQYKQIQAVSANAIQHCREMPWHTQNRLAQLIPTSFPVVSDQVRVKCEVDSGQKWTEKELLCSCRQPPVEICDFSRHLKSASPDIPNFCFKNNDFGRCPAFFKGGDLVSRP